MRIKDLWSVFPLPAKIKLVWDRLTFTKTTTIYFVFSALHCAVQVFFQVHAFQINVQAADFLAFVTEQGNATNENGFYVFGDDLRFCDNVPMSVNASECQVLWDGNKTLTQTSFAGALVMNATLDASPAKMTVHSGVTASTNSPYPSSTFTSTTEDARNCNNNGVCNESVIIKRTDSNPGVFESNGTVQVVFSRPGLQNENVTLDRECLWVLGWPVQTLRNTEREDLTFIMFQIWVLGMSTVAILNESVPHIVATLLTHLVSTGWGGFQIFSTIQFRGEFTEITINGACHSIDLLQNYWNSRSIAQLLSLILNSVALLVSVFLSWKLVRSFGWQTFKRIGASPAISRTYKIVLTLSIVIQLSLFFIVTSITLWIDQVWNGAIARMAVFHLYRPLLFVTLALLPVWLAFGWYSVRREQKIGTLIFLILCCGYLAGWGAMLDSITFRWTYMTWMFFALVTTASVLLTLLAFILGVMCRLNFGKGLLHYLKSHEPIEKGFEPIIVGDVEKMVFPSSSGPTFPATTGSGIRFSPLSQVATQNAVQPVKMNIQTDIQTALQQPPPAATRTPQCSVRVAPQMLVSNGMTRINQADSWSMDTMES